MPIAMISGFCKESRRFSAGIAIRNPLKIGAHFRPVVAAHLLDEVEAASGATCERKGDRGNQAPLAWPRERRHRPGGLVGTGVPGLFQDHPGARDRRSRGLAASGSCNRGVLAAPGAGHRGGCCRRTKSGPGFPDSRTQPMRDCVRDRCCRGRRRWAEVS